jgi:broad specificity phosphatase PhoE
MTLDLLRHGEPEGGRLYRGNLLDNPLSEKGWAKVLNPSTVVPTLFNACFAF